MSRYFETYVAELQRVTRGFTTHQRPATELRNVSVTNGVAFPLREFAIAYRLRARADGGEARSNSGWRYNRGGSDETRPNIANTVISAGRELEQESLTIVRSASGASRDADSAPVAVK